MLRGRLLWSIPNRLSGHQNKWSMLKYRVDIEEKPYHEEQFAVADDIDFSYLLPKDHPNYKPPGKPVKSEMQLLSPEERAVQYPEVKIIII